MAAKKGHNPKAYTTETPIVAAYIAFMATPREVRPETEKTSQQFMKNHGLKATNSLANYAKIDGFDRGVYQLREKWKYHYLNKANEALEKRLDGMKLQSVNLNGAGKIVSRTVQEIAASDKAIELAHRIFGDLKDKVEISSSTPILRAAKRLDELEKKERANNAGKPSKQ